MEMDILLTDCLASVSMKTSQLNLDEVLDFGNEEAKELKRGESLAAKIQADVKAAKEKLSTLDKERANARSEVTKIKDDNAMVTKKLNKLEAEIKDAKYKINRTKQISSITKKEREILQKNEEELHAYKAFTGIRWNFNVPDNVVEGMITNSSNNFVKTFTFDKSTSIKKIRESIWSHIKEAASESWQEVEDNKENEMIVV